MIKRILCFGDSNTWGAIPNEGGRCPAHVRWTGVLQSLLGNEWIVIEEGLNGRTSVWEDYVEGKMSGLDYLVPCLDSQAPLDLVVLMLGTNDTKTRFGCNAAMIAFGMQRLINAVRNMNNALLPHPPVLLISPILISDHYKSAALYGILGEGCVEKSLEFSKEYSLIAKQEGCYFLDAATVANPSPIDGLHMEPESHSALAHAVYKEICKIFSEKV